MNSKLKKYFAAALFSLVTLTAVFPNTAVGASETITASDLKDIKQYLSGSRKISYEEYLKYDVNKDNKLDIFDLAYAKYELYLDSEPVLIQTPSSKQLDVSMTLQNPELPTGCEVTALTMLLNFYGYNVTKLFLADLMPKMDFYTYNGKYYGADYITTFPGNPHYNSGYGCYTPCMVTTAENYFAYSGSDAYYLADTTGVSFEKLFDFVDSGRPVMVWATMNMIEPKDTVSWYTPEDKYITWHGNEHCLLITGYDKEKDLVYVNDPLKGKVSYVTEIFKNRYEQMGSFSAVLLEKGTKPEDILDKYETPSTPVISTKHYIGEKVKYTGLVYFSANGGKSVEVSGTFTISDILDDVTKPYRIRLDTQGWVPYDFQ